MPYQVLLSNGALLTTIQDDMVDTTTSLTLIGRSYPDYGTYVATDLVHLLENSAYQYPPANPLIGQLWYDTGVPAAMKVWNGSIWYTLTPVRSVLGYTGAITAAQMVAGGLAPLASPALSGIPTAPTAAIDTSTTQLATTAFVLNQFSTIVTGVSSVLGYTGAVTLSDMVTGGLAPTASPALSGIPTAPTAAVDTSTTQLATTAFVTAQIAFSTAGLAPLASPALSGIPTAPTPPVNDSSTAIATTAFVRSALPTLTSAAVTNALGFVPVQQGTGSNQLSNTVKVGWSTTGLRCTVDVTDLGLFAMCNASNEFTSNNNFTNTITANGLITASDIVAESGNITALGGYFRTGNGYTAQGYANSTGTWDQLMATMVGDFGFSAANNGWFSLPNGLLLQWGVLILGNGANQVIALNRAFPVACLWVSASYGSEPSGSCTCGAAPIAGNKSQIYIGNSTGGTNQIWWWAIGA